MMIVATVGIPIVQEDRIRKMIIAGADVFRFNLSYYNPEDGIKYIKTVENIKNELNSDVKILIEFPPNKILLGEFTNNIFGIQENQELTLRSAPFTEDCENFVPVDTKNLGEKVRMNQTISLANGRISLQVTEILNKDLIKVRVLNNGVIKSRQTFNNNVYLENREMLEKYKSILDNITHLKPEYLAISYLGEEFTNDLKNLPEMQQIKSHTKIMIKIEKEITRAELEKLCIDDYFHRIIIDRGELGVNMPFEKIGIYQKYLTSTIKKFNKKFLISTQILNSTLDNFIPRRSDILDLTNIILDGADGIVLTKETSLNKRPIYAISVAKKIIEEVQNYKNKNL